MSSYAIVSSCALLGLGLIWSKSSAIDILIKLACCGIGVWGLIARFAS